MGESHSLFRIAIFLGFILLMGSVLSQPWVYVGQPLPPNSAWGQFSSGIQDFPVFVNPFDQRGYFTSASLTDGHVFQTIPTHATSSSSNCGNISYYNCLADPGGPDFNSSYIALNSANQTQFNFTNSFYPDSSARPGIVAQGVDWTRFSSFQVELWCRWAVAPTNGNTSVALVFIHDVDARNHEVFGADSTKNCPVGPWGHVTFLDDSFAGAPDDANSQMSIDIETAFFTTDGILDVSTMYVKVFVSSEATCTGGGWFGDFGCQAVNFGNKILKFGQLLLNAVVFGGAVLFWFVGMAGIFFSSLLSILAIPGAPPIITGFVGILVIGCLFFVAIVFMGKIRGTGNTG